ncbi:P-loop containing nucleoside triphosphate hydrolase protein [Ascobolus immersus RN42]|uniref:Signal recognition particle receptor subunit alpha homolog n=1 Tax=Ascobolus immersus RN42 TaxID=1160509 RepID=A0A3N4IJK2_ASCIM|nr:P-loop containing nucleoside triphosphate hydrolase protein [Ascobolus immersus RN42]
MDLYFEITSLSGFKVISWGSRRISDLGLRAIYRRITILSENSTRYVADNDTYEACWATALNKFVVLVIGTTSTGERVQHSRALQVADNFTRLVRAGQISPSTNAMVARLSPDQYVSELMRGCNISNANEIGFLQSFKQQLDNAWPEADNERIRISIPPSKQLLYERLLERNVDAEIAKNVSHQLELDDDGKLDAKAVGNAITLCSSVTPYREGILDKRREHDGVYVMAFIGVNGVGKSTTLAKITSLLLQQGCSVLIAACDTFRSGAVEQLRAHVANLQTQHHKAKVSIFEQGYGVDPRRVAKDAISHAAKQSLDVVLLDTAGIRHNDAKLIAKLEAFLSNVVCQEVFFVVEAVSGNNAIKQVSKFSSCIRENVMQSIVVTKCDTAGNKVGTVLNLQYYTKLPVSFIGIGQAYSDLRLYDFHWLEAKLFAP